MTNPRRGSGLLTKITVPAEKNSLSGNSYGLSVRGQRGVGVH